MKDDRINPQVHGDHIGHAPIRKHRPQRRAGHERSGEFAVQRTDVPLGDVHHHLLSGLAEVLGRTAEKRLGKMGVVEPDDRNPQRRAGRQRLPRDLIRVAGLDDVRLLLFQDALDGLEIDQRAVAGFARHQRRADRVNAGRPVIVAFRLGTGNDQDVPVASVPAEIVGFLGEITFHPAADGGIKLGQVADFQAATSSLGSAGWAADGGASAGSCTCSVR